MASEKDDFANFLKNIIHRVTYFARNFLNGNFWQNKQRDVSLSTVVFLILQEILQSYPFLMARNFKKQGSIGSESNGLVEHSMGDLFNISSSSISSINQSRAMSLIKCYFKAGKLWIPIFSISSLV